MPDDALPARVFRTGGSQAIRIPAAFRFETETVWLRRDPLNGDLIVSASPAWTPAHILDHLASLPPIPADDLEGFPDRSANAPLPFDRDPFAQGSA